MARRGTLAQLGRGCRHARRKGCRAQKAFDKYICSVQERPSDGLYDGRRMVVANLNLLIAPLKPDGGQVPGAVTKRNNRYMKKLL